MLWNRKEFKVVDYNDLCYYIVLVCSWCARFVWHWMREFYKNILHPIRFFMYIYILPAISNMITLVVNTLMWFCVQFFQLILLPNARFCYIYIIIPSCMLLDNVSTALYKTFSLLFTKLVVACVWILQNIVEPLCLFTVDYFCYASSFIYKYIMIFLWDVMYTICPFVYIQIVRPVGRLVLHIAPIIRYTLNKFVFYPIGYVFYTVGYFFYGFVVQPLSTRLSEVSRTMVNVFGIIVNAMGNGLHVTGQAVATAGEAVMSILRSINGH
jgi:hypothetical protein